MALQLPKDGSIIIIDDQYNEAKPLIDILTKNGHPSIYFNGDIEQLPDTNLERVRIIFADIQLKPALDGHQYATIIIDHLNALISDKNGPYILLVWSGKGHLYFNGLKEMINAPAFTKKPIALIEINKANFYKTITSSSYDENILKEELNTRFSKEDIEYILSKVGDTIPDQVDKIFDNAALKKISKVIKNELKDFRGFELLIKWENLVTSAATKLTSDFSSIHSINEFWDFNFRNIIARLAQAQVGEALIKLDRPSFVKASFETINAALSDYLDAEVLSGISITPTEETSYKSSGYAILRDEIEYKIVWKDYTHFELYIDTIKKGGNSKKITDLKGIAGNNESLKEIVMEMTNSYVAINPILNTKLNIDFHTKFPFQPGVVYEIKVETETKRKFLSNTYFTTNFLETNKDGIYKIPDDLIDNIKFIELEVSPNCDFANNKWIKHRTVSGIIYPSELYKKDKILRGDSIYDEFPVFKFENKICQMVLSFKLLKSFDLNKGKKRSKKFIFKIKDQPMADIITRMSSHASRIGVLEFK